MHVIPITPEIEHAAVSTEELDEEFRCKMPKGSDKKRKATSRAIRGLVRGYIGRRYRTRTDDPHRVKVMLYRLS